MDAMTVGIDLAKNVIEIAISVGEGQVAARRRLTRRQFGQFVDTLTPGIVIIMEACGSAHYWGRRCHARGAVVRLLPAQYVRPYVRRNKTDRADAEALLEAHRCGGIHAVPVKTVEQQTLQALHRVRQQWQRTRTARLNSLRALLRELGVLLPVGAAGVTRHVAAHLEDGGALPPLVHGVVRALLDDVHQVETHLAAVDRQLRVIVQTHPIAARLHHIAGIGPVTATALVGSVPHIAAFRRGRQFASWLGLTPREWASGDRRVYGGLSKRGDRYLRTLLIHGGRAVLRAAEVHHARHPVPRTRLEAWALEMAARRGRNRTAVALANKLARIVWAVWRHEQDFVPMPVGA